MTRLVTSLALVVSLADPSDLLSVIKPSRSGGLGGQLGVPFDGRFVATNVTVFDVIAAAYGGYEPLDAGHISNVPAWAKSERFDIEARTENAAPTEDSPEDQSIAAAFAIVRTMLADRFALRVHDSARVESVYALQRTSRRPGLTPTARDCDADGKAGPFVETPRGSDGVRLPPCGLRARRGEISASGATMALLASRLSHAAGVGRVVLDRTALTGRYDFTLRWTPPPAPADAGDPGNTIDSGPSIFTALREQLGLALMSTTGSVRVLVIDHIGRPSPN